VASVDRRAPVLRSCAPKRFGLRGRSALSICGQAYYGQHRTGDSDRTITVFDTPLAVSDRFKQKYWGAQLDVGYRPSDNLEFGVTGGYQRSEADISTSSELDASGYNLGLYAEYGMATGLYAGLLVKHDVNKLRFTSPLIVRSAFVRA
jgi:hypothetical protein